MLFGHFCHYCHCCHYLHYCNNCHNCHYFHIGWNVGRLLLAFITLKITFSQRYATDEGTNRWIDGSTDGPTTRSLELLWAAKNSLFSLITMYHKLRFLFVFRLEATFVDWKMILENLISWGI
jgi:hypothetical protein